MVQMSSMSIRVSQVLSGTLMLVSLVLLVTLTIHYKRHPKPIEGIDYFPPKSEKELAAEEQKRERKELRKKAKEMRIRDGKATNKPETQPSEEDDSHAED